MKSGIVFDLDGTLVDSVPGIACGLNLALKGGGFPQHSVQAVGTMVGRGAMELCKASLRAHFNGEPPQDAVEAVHRGFMEEYRHTWQTGTVPFDGIRELLLELAAAGHPLAVLSNKPHVVTVPLVKQIFPDVPFSIVMGFSDQFPRKPSPDALLHIAAEWGKSPDRIYMVGDSAHDGHTALNAATRLVLVGWGYSARAALEAFSAPLCDTVEELRTALMG